MGPRPIQQDGVPAAPNEKSPQPGISLANLPPTGAPRGATGPAKATWSPSLRMARAPRTADS